MLYICDSLQSEPGASTISISSASKEDIATFTCEAQNGVKDSEGNVTVERVDVKVTVIGEEIWR